MQVVPFSGADLVHCLLEHEYAFAEEEALRLGNSLMDAGCLHHNLHSQGFHVAPADMYFFEKSHLDLQHPDRLSLGSLQHADTTVVLGDSSGNQGCSCRKLGQGHVKAKTGLAQKPLPRRPKTTIDNQPLTMHLLDEPGSDMLDFGHFRSTTSATLRLAD
ncbi:Aste57867_5323 [Aphanomyces stellatus]|uniref:Aste57867_5323 protein n=1 Tax=Aphanomyces stellatus TaxID=120398 RepID=A0A485KHC6_9STRA|nr:hypothetical protein As57867_005310 [Aphanomyces stellatus]VFT82388.1 Aste57867_5323 [Aphanomyces stellatus]